MLFYWWMFIHETKASKLLLYLRADRLFLYAIFFFFFFFRLLALNMKIFSPSAHLGNTTDKATAGCLSGILRRFLCGDNVSSHVTEDTTYTGYSPFQYEETKEKVEVPPPNLVARLMGLESMPEFDWVPRTPNTIGRSRSANSLHNWIDLDPARCGRRRLKSCTSFREIPTFLQLENEDFLLLSFGCEDKGEEILRPQVGGKGIEERRVDASNRKSRENRRKLESQGKKKTGPGTGSCKEKIPERRNEDRLSGRDPRNGEIKKNREKFRKPAHVLLQGKPLESVTDHNVFPQATKISKKKKTKASAGKKSDCDCSSEDSSPVSVLDHPFQVENDFLLSEEDSSPEKSKSRRQGSCNRTSLNTHQSSLTAERIPKPVQNEVKELKKLNCELPELSNLCTEISTFLEEDVKKTNWVFRERWKGEEFEEIGTEVGLQVFDRLLHEALTELLVVR
ncbi:uncharacterized protein [Aristolochia californica]|uniref:uncharacterized protein n=1 Tax=Aristolochia californica TaxID=171875 RepID=UPI0035D9AFBD